MNKQKNILTLNQSLALHFPKATHDTRKTKNVKLFIQVLMVELSRLGFKLDRSLLTTLKTYSASELKAVHKFLMDQLSEISGDHVEHIPLFKNFPEDVPDKDAYNMSRFIGFFQNYLMDQDEIPGKALSCGHKIDSELFSIEDFGACPICQMKVSELNSKANKPELTEKIIYKKIKALTVSQQEEMILNLFSYSRPYSPKQRKDLDTFITSVGVPALKYLPKEPKIKENFTYLAFQVYKLNPSLVNDEVKSWFKTSTDILRLIAQISGSLNVPKVRSLDQTFGKEASLAAPFKIKLPNSARKLVLGLLERIPSPIEDMIKYRNLWLAVGKYLHVESYNKLINVNKAFNLLRNENKEIKTYSQITHNLLASGKKKDITEAITLLVKRPGMYVRNLDQLLRKSDSAEKVVENLPLVLDQIPLAMLLKVNAHFTKRTEKSETRYFIPKGEVSKIYVMDKDSRKPLEPKVIAEVKKLINEELKSRFKKTLVFEGCSNIFIDPKLKDILVPLNIQSSTKAMNTVQRGSKLDITMGQTLRLFCYWKQNDSRIDVDLIMVGFDSNLEIKNQVSWTNLQDSGITHSGDIQSAPEGASEFIDIETNVLLKQGIRYVGVSVNSFTGQKFNSFQSFAGVMVRNKPKSGEVYEPSTVHHKFDLSANSTVNIPFLVDLKTGQLIWVDISGGEKSSRMISPKQIKRVIQAAQAMEHNSPNMYDLLSLHAKASKTDINKLNHLKDYDQVFDVDYVLDVAEVLSNYVK